MIKKDQKIEIAERLISALGKGRVWAGDEVVRVYIGKGWATILADGSVDINYVKRADFAQVKEACEKNNIKAVRL